MNFAEEYTARFRKLLGTPSGVEMNVMWDGLSIVAYWQDANGRTVSQRFSDYSEVINALSEVEL